MTTLELEASDLYFELTRFHFHTEKVSWSHYLARMAALKNMCEPSDPIHRTAARTLRVEEWDVNEEWPTTEEDFDVQATATETNIDDQPKPGIRRNKKGYIEFLSRRKGLKDWVFHQYDADFHPSIPHGHFQGKSQPKLDSYLGWVYQGSKQISRLSRDLIIDLWNDEEFRQFAYTSVSWYKEEFRNYNWRVSNPLLLPRRR